LIAAFIMRSVPTRRSSRAFIASFMALLMVSRSTEAPLCAKKPAVHSAVHMGRAAFDGGGPEAYLGRI